MLEFCLHVDLRTKEEGQGLLASGMSSRLDGPPPSDVECRYGPCIYLVITQLASLNELSICRPASSCVGRSYGSLFALLQTENDAQIFLQEAKVVMSPMWMGSRETSHPFSHQFLDSTLPLLPADGKNNSVSS